MRTFSGIIWQQSGLHLADIEVCCAISSHAWGDRYLPRPSKTSPQELLSLSGPYSSNLAHSSNLSTKEIGTKGMKRIPKSCLKMLISSVFP